MLEAVAELRAFIADEHDPESPGARLAQRLAEYLEGAADGCTLEELLDLKPGRGQAPWWQVEKAQRQRDTIAHLRDLVSTGGYKSDAEAIREAAFRYKNGRWRFDSQRPEAPTTGAMRAALHALLSTTDGEIPSRRSVERALDSCDRK